MEKTLGELEDVFGELLEAFQNYRPDIDAFEDGEAELEEMKEIDALAPTTEKGYQAAIELLNSFLCNWFPDELSAEENEQLQTLLEKAKEVTSIKMIGRGN